MGGHGISATEEHAHEWMSSVEFGDDCGDGYRKKPGKDV